MSDLTAEEQKNVRAALRFLRARMGGWKAVAKAVHAQPHGLFSLSGKTISASLAVRVARFAGVGVDEVLVGRWPPADTCPHCGQTSAR